MTELPQHWVRLNRAQLQDPIKTNPLIVVDDVTERLAAFERNPQGSDPIPYDSISCDAIRYYTEAEIPVDVMTKVCSGEAFSGYPTLTYEVITRLSKVLS